LIAKRHFIAGERYTIADITAILAFRLGEFAGLTPQREGVIPGFQFYGAKDAR
jgi:glutathione S-transferase